MLPLETGDVRMPSGGEDEKSLMVICSSLFWATGNTSKCAFSLDWGPSSLFLNLCWGEWWKTNFELYLHNTGETFLTWTSVDSYLCNETGKWWCLRSTWKAMAGQSWLGPSYIFIIFIFSHKKNIFPSWFPESFGCCLERNRLSLRMEKAIALGTKVFKW